MNPSASLFARKSVIFIFIRITCLFDCLPSSIPRVASQPNSDPTDAASQKRPWGVRRGAALRTLRPLGCGSRERRGTSGALLDDARPGARPRPRLGGGARKPRPFRPAPAAPGGGRRRTRRAEAALRPSGRAGPRLPASCASPPPSRRGPRAPADSGTGDGLALTGGAEWGGCGEASG